MNWQATLPPTEALLRAGGDERLHVNADSGLDKYGCQARPAPDCAEFGSSTATSISAAAWAQADALRQCLLQLPPDVSAEQAYEQGLRAIHDELLVLCGLSGEMGLSTLFAASGTDVHLIASRLLGHRARTSPLIVMMDGAETGSGVQQALHAQHFAQASALGHRHQRGTPLCSADAQAPSVVHVAVRLGDGQPRPLAQVHQEVEALVSAAVHAGRPVLLVALDVSKTGLQVPAPGFLSALKQRWPTQVDVMVDACQFRLGLSTLKACLDQGFMVAMTGSKFLTGPSFCGALFVPQSVRSRLVDHALPAGLGDYCVAAEWPVSWPARALLPAQANFGLLMRWQACLAELRAFRRVPPAHVRHFLKVFAQAVSQRLAASALLEPLGVPALARWHQADTRADDWDAIQTIFPFVLYRRTADGGRVLLSASETQAIYQALQRGPGLRVQLGQPVSCGQRGHTAMAALRLCSSARLVVEATSGRGERAQQVIQRAMQALDLTEQLIEQHHPCPALEVQHASPHP